MAEAMSARRYLVLMTLLAGLALLAGNLAQQKLLAGARIDFTSGGLYTLSPATRAALQELAEPVELTLVYTPRAAQDYPQVRAYAARVRELLAAYQAIGGANLRVTEIDPRPFSEAEDEALAAGIPPVGPGGSDPLYFGLIGRNSIDETRIIPFLSPDRETSLEYDLTRMIVRLDKPEPPRIGILSTLPGMRVPDGESGHTVLQDIARSYRAELIPDDFSALPEVDILLMAHPPALTSRQEWLVDQFILRQGRAVIAVDPAALTVASAGAFMPGAGLARSGLGRLGEAWGITLSPAAVADAANALPVPVETGPGRVEEMANPLFVGAPAGLFSQEDPVTAGLRRGVNFGAPGALVAGELPAGATLSPLITTGPAPAYIDAAVAARNPPPPEVLRAYRAEAEPLTLAARLSGTLPTAFPAGPPQPDLPGDAAEAEAVLAAAANLPPHIARSEVSAEIILIADADFMDDGFYVMPGSGVTIADNGALVLNALDALSGGGELASLRARAPSLRPMQRIEQMRAEAEARFLREQRDLEVRLETAESRLSVLQAAAGERFAASDPESALSEAERAELTSLRADILGYRARLRAIERDYRQGIDQLESTLKAINIWGGPVLVALAGLIVWHRQRRRRKRSS
ncbi:GldG family protein [Hyphomonas sp.]|uniref:GldG family protein n=1 Tax=Hyphomonas sp. TaxID=87 RepID=UPI00391BB9B6